MLEYKILLITELEKGFEIQEEGLCSSKPEITSDLRSYLDNYETGGWQLVACLPMTYETRGGTLTLVKWRLILLGPGRH